ncbi:hypothetical protein BASA84_000233 [Batrachochytrium salamandrivorans]|nr:hypothetical protein BASA84_000233 [Batrachochytrium salamandrivorans]
MAVLVLSPSALCSNPSTASNPYVDQSRPRPLHNDPAQNLNLHMSLQLQQQYHFPAYDTQQQQYFHSQQQSQQHHQYMCQQSYRQQLPSRHPQQKDQLQQQQQQQQQFLLSKPVYHQQLPFDEPVSPFPASCSMFGLGTGTGISNTGVAREVSRGNTDGLDFHIVNTMTSPQTSRAMLPTMSTTKATTTSATTLASSCPPTASMGIAATPASTDGSGNASGDLPFTTATTATALATRSMSIGLDDALFPYTPLGLTTSQTESTSLLQSTVDNGSQQSQKQSSLPLLLLLQNSKSSQKQSIQQQSDNSLRRHSATPLYRHPHPGTVYMNHTQPRPSSVYEDWTAENNPYSSSYSNSQYSGALLSSGLETPISLELELERVHDLNKSRSSSQSVSPELQFHHQQQQHSNNIHLYINNDTSNNPITTSSSSSSSSNNIPIISCNSDIIPIQSVPLLSSPPMLVHSHMNTPNVMYAGLDHHHHYHQQAAFASPNPSLISHLDSTPVYEYAYDSIIPSNTDLYSAIPTGIYMDQHPQTLGQINPQIIHPGNLTYGGHYHQDTCQKPDPSSQQLHSGHISLRELHDEQEEQQIQHHVQQQMQLQQQQQQQSILLQHNGNSAMPFTASSASLFGSSTLSIAAAAAAESPASPACGTSPASPSRESPHRAATSVALLATASTSLSGSESVSAHNTSPSARPVASKSKIARRSSHSGVSSGPSRGKRLIGNSRGVGKKMASARSLPSLSLDPIPITTAIPTASVKFTTSSSGSNRRSQVKIACVHCKSACKKCDSQRPCARCVRIGKPESCRDAPRKERRYSGIPTTSSRALSTKEHGSDLSSSEENVALGSLSCTQTSLLTIDNHTSKE